MQDGTFLAIHMEESPQINFPKSNFFWTMDFFSLSVPSSSNQLIGFTCFPNPDCKKIMYNSLEKVGTLLWWKYLQFFPCMKKLWQFIIDCLFIACCPLRIDRVNRSHYNGSLNYYYWRISYTNHPLKERKRMNIFCCKGMLQEPFPSSFFEYY